jgi:L-threonylcarbamoyladenylate synthase
VLARQDEGTATETVVKTVAWLTLPADPAAYAQRLYAALRELDAQGANLIAIEAVPQDDAWAAVHDRLRRATRGAGTR